MKKEAYDDFTLCSLPSNAVEMLMDCKFRY